MGGGTGGGKTRGSVWYINMFSARILKNLGLLTEVILQSKGIL